MARAQIEFGESIMVVIILVFLLVLGMVFYHNANRASIAKQGAYEQDIDAVLLAKAVVALPELRCPAYVQGDGCIDGYKLDALAGMLDSGDTTYDAGADAYYAERFGYATVTVHDVLAGTDHPLYSDRPTNATSMPHQFIFVTLYDPAERTRNLAYLDVTRYRAVTS